MCPQVVTLGEAMLRLSPPGGARLQEADGLDLFVAGAEANVSAALASLGEDVAWVSALPDVPLGRRVARELCAAGVDLKYVEWSPEGRVGLFFVEFGTEPRPTSVWYDRAGSSFSAMKRFAPDALEGARFALTSGITPVISEHCRELAQDFVNAARGAGATVCIDVNFRERLCSPGQARSQLKPLLAEAGVVVCSRVDARRVFGVESDEISEVAMRLREGFAPEADVLVITDGANGSAGIEGDRVYHQQAIEATVTDRIGAGDAFLAGLLWGLLADAALERSLRYAAALGALKCTVRGDQALFTPAEVRAAATTGKVALIR